MKDIENILLCGLGAIGSVYANILCKYENFRVLVDEKRYERYTKEPLLFNGKELKLNYILPDNKSFNADLIIIATKYDGLFEAAENIKNFVNKDTLILSLLNGVTSEDIIAKKYGREKIPYSYFIGHSAVRNGRSITQDGIYQTVFGSDNPETVKRLKAFFDKSGIKYSIPDDIKHSMWSKFMLNACANQISAVLGLTFGEMLADEKCMNLALEVMHEVANIAKACKVKNSDSLIDETMENLHKMIPEGKTSMLQDIEAGRKTEADMFAGVIIDLGKKYGIKTPLNEFLKTLIEIKEKKNISQARPL